MLRAAGPSVREGLAILWEEVVSGPVASPVRSQNSALWAISPVLQISILHQAHSLPYHVIQIMFRLWILKMHSLQMAPEVIKARP